jgi:hypothetical protein|nr:hypothetical protein [Candidatus Acidoferrales bacterium]
MISALRSISAILMGFITGFVIIAGCVYLNLRLFPLPAGIDPEDTAAMNAAMAAMPAKSLILVLVGWAIGTIGASFMAARFAGQFKSLHGLLMGLIFLGGAIMTMRQSHHPLWFWIVGIIIFFPAAIIGSSLAVPREGTSASSK